MPNSTSLLRNFGSPFSVSLFATIIESLVVVVVVVVVVWNIWEIDRLRNQELLDSLVSTPQMVKFGPFPGPSLLSSGLDTTAE